jgi:hypothetical protein
MAGTYLRFDMPARSDRLFESSRISRPLTFVDIVAPSGWSADSLADLFRDFRSRLMPDAGTLLVRFPAQIGRSIDQAEVHELAESLGSHPSVPKSVAVGVVTFAVGAAPTITWTNDRQASDVPQRLLSDARTLEIEALADWGNAIWAPLGYHFQLPSGRHDGTFVKVADMFGDPRDAEVMASWLAPRLRETRSIVSDTGSLSALIVAAKAIQERAGIEPSAIFTIDSFPRSVLEARRLLRQAAGQGGHVALLISVAGSGRLTSSFMQAAALELRPGSWSVDHVIDRNGRLIAPEVDSWLTIGPDPQPLGPTCRWCADPNRSRVVQMDPRSLGTILLPRPALIMPHVLLSLSNRGLWKHMDDGQILGAEVPPSSTAKSYRRRNSTMGLRVHLDRLGTSPGFLDLVRRRAESVRDGTVRVLPAGLKDEAPTKDFIDADMVIITEHLAEFKPLAQTLLEAWGSLGSREPIWQEWTKKSILDLAGVSRILVLSPGFVTGRRLREVLLAIRDATPTNSPPVTVAGLVVHARPEQFSEWQSTFNTYERRLRALWFTGLPSQSPLRREARIFVDVETEGAFEDSRRTLLSKGEWSIKRTELGDKAGHVLWCASNDRPRVRGESIYGTELGELAAFFAVGSAITHARMDALARDPHGWAMFDISKIIGSYFDAVIIASILRWLEPGEIWWGSSVDGGGVEENIDRLLTMTTDARDLAMLIPELLLAVLEGRVPDSALEKLLHAADGVHDETGALACVRHLHRRQSRGDVA